jgi:hypothetical protein
MTAEAAIAALTASLTAAGHRPADAAEIAAGFRGDRLVDPDGHVDATAVAAAAATVSGVTVVPRRSYGAGTTGPLLQGSAETQGAEQARRRGYLTQPTTPEVIPQVSPQVRSRFGRGAAGRAEAARRFGTQARR